MVHFVKWYASGGQIAYRLSCDSSTTQPVSRTVHFDGVDTVDYEQTINQLLLDAKSASFSQFLNNVAKSNSKSTDCQSDSSSEST